MIRYSVLSFLVFHSLIAFTQPNDGIKIAEARLALEKYNDCRAALTALRSITPAGRKTTVFYLYSGKTFDCLKQYDSALHYYNLYLKDNPNSSDVIQRCAEINYQKTKEKLRYDLEGSWYAKDEPAKVRYIEQRGNYIKFTTDESDGRRDNGVIFEGRLLESGVYKGGTEHHLTDDEITKLDKMCDICTNKNNKECKAGYLDSEFNFVKYSGHDQVLDDYYIETEDDVLSVSADGKKITVKKRVISDVRITSCYIAVNFRSVTYEYIRLER